MINTKEHTFPNLYKSVFSGFFVFILLNFSGLAQSKNPLTIIFSKDYGKGEYQNWIKRPAGDCKIISLFHVRRDSVAYWLDKADGFLLTGGEDIFPGLYDQAGDTINCGDIDRHRDSLEIQIINAAIARKKPLFGICRGEQISNVFFGGSLFVDVPSELGKKVNHRNDGPCQHSVSVISGTTLANLSKVKSGLILSNHHQGIKRLGKGLQPMAKSDDGLIEAVEKNRELDIPFFMAVQWHPERMDADHPLSAPLAKAFVEACLMVRK